MYKIKKYNLAFTVALVLSTTGCNSLLRPNSDVAPSRVNVEKSYLDQKTAEIKEQNLTETQNDINAGGIQHLHVLSQSNQDLKLEIDLANQFSNNKKHQMSVNSLPLNDFLHYALGELLQVSYLIEPTVKANNVPVTLELKESITSKRLFQLTRQVLSQNNINIALNDGIFYIHPALKDDQNSAKAFGFGREESSVPNVSSEIIQLVPVEYGMSPGLRSTLNRLVDAEVSLDQVQGLLTVVGKRETVIRALSLVKLLDSPSVYNKAVALLTFNYIDSESFIEKVTLLLAQQGIKVGGRFVGSGSINFVPIEHLGQIVVFATADEIINKVEYWREQLDKPATGAEQSFYIYHPKYARAADLGQSLAPLLGGSLSGGNKGNQKTTSASTSNNVAANQASANSVQTVEGDNMRLVVDDRSNALIFYSSGKYYQELQPIIRQLDVMPKQVMLEVVIAEVKLAGTFAKGVEFAVKNGPSGSRTENFSFKGEGGFAYSIVGMNGTVNLNLNQTDSLVNVLSRPTLLVRDGVSANISVGDDIPTVGSTTSDPINGDRETTTIQYRKTGVDLMVTPTVNAQGTVIMSIEQNISNVSSASSLDGSPAVFERKVNTEVVAGDGQTVMLGGLISENKNTSATSIPLLGDIPILGHLFRTDSEETDKTELVILVTPKIIHNLEDWQRVKDSFIKGLENLKF